MYSVVLMAAMTSGVETPGCGRPHVYYYSGCQGYYSGCQGYYYGGCQGYYYGGCHGYYRSGCYGYNRIWYYSENIIVPGQTVIANSVVPNVIGDGGQKQPMARAEIRVKLPENARLFVDSHPTTSTGAARELTTPPLETGKQFTYTLTATIVRNQQDVKLERQVTVRAGEKTEVTLEFPLEIAQK
jgi:uncharacterized protein (TIGR03000 family)